MEFLAAYYKIFYGLGVAAVLWLMYNTRARGVANDEIVGLIVVPTLLGLVLLGPAEIGRRHNAKLEREAARQQQRLTQRQAAEPSKDPDSVT